MALMAKRGRRPKHGLPGDDGRTGTSLNFRMDPELFAALETFIEAQKFRTTKTDVVEVALQELLKAEGFWPFDPKKIRPKED